MIGPVVVASHLQYRLKTFHSSPIADNTAGHDKTFLSEVLAIDKDHNNLQMEMSIEQLSVHILYFMWSN